MPGGVRLRIFLVCSALMFLILGAALLSVRLTYAAVMDHRLIEQLHVDARLLREALAQRWSVLDDQELTDLIAPLRDARTEIVISAIDGRVLFNTLADPAFARDLFFQPEVKEALKTGWATHKGRLPGAQSQYRTLAIRAGNDDSIRGVLWIARPSAEETDAGILPGALLFWFLVLTIFSAGVLTLAAEAFRTRFCRRVIAIARELSDNETAAVQSVPVESEEYAMLSAALRRVREKLADQLTTIDRQRLTLKTLVDQLHEGVIVTDSNGRIALMNPSAARLMNLPIHSGGDTHLQMIGKPVERCIPRHEILEMLTDPPEMAETGLRSGGDESDSAPFTPAASKEQRIQIDSPKGAIYLLAHASPILLPADESETPRSSLGHMLVLTDITDLTSVIRVKTDFVANASHELRTPLAAIRAAVDTILNMDFDQEADAARRFAGTIQRQSARLEALVSDLLDLSRLESQTARFDPTALNLRFELEELHSRFERRLKEKAIRWLIDLGQGAPSAIVVNPHLLHLVLDNLVDNAIKFTEEGGGITIACTGTSECVSITVADTGCGIPPDERQRVFERFYQVERARSGDNRGTGLGLSIVRHAVAAMKGGVSLESELGKGTRITVKLPQPRTNGLDRAVRS